MSLELCRRSFNKWILPTGKEKPAASTTIHKVAVNKTQASQASQGSQDSQAIQAFLDSQASQAAHARDSTAEAPLLNQTMAAGDGSMANYTMGNQTAARNVTACQVKPWSMDLPSYWLVIIVPEKKLYIFYYYIR